MTTANTLQDAKSRPHRRRAKRGNGQGSMYFDDRMKLWRATVQIGGGKNAIDFYRNARRDEHLGITAGQPVILPGLRIGPRTRLHRSMGRSATWNEIKERPMLGAPSGLFIPPRS